MWNLAFLFIFILYVDAKNSNLCRGNPPRCDGDKIIRVDVVKCPTSADPIMWNLSETSIRMACDGVKYCDIKKLESAIFPCCGNKDIKKPKLRFVYDCVQEEIVTTKPTPPKLPTTTSSVMNAVSTKQTTPSADIDNFCVTNICYQKPYCSAGTEIAVMKITDSFEPDQVMNSLTYYCNKRQRCIDEPYIDNKCKSENNMKFHYVCMKEKVTTTVMCDTEETIDNDEGQIRSSDYPNMIPEGTNNCQIRFYFENLSIMELFLIDLPTLEVMHQDKYHDWSSSRNNASRHMFILPAYQVYLNIELNKLPQRRIWMYYRVLPTNSNHSSGKTGMPWTNSCQNQVTTPEPMNLTTLKSNPGISEMSKMTMFKVSSSPNPSKDMHSMHKTGANQGEKELSTAPHIVIPDGIPVDTEVVDKMEPVTIPVMPSNTGSISSSTSSSNGGDVRPVEKPPNHPTHHENREKASSVSETPTTGLYSREVVIGLIAGVVILACLVIILLTALVASMRRRRRSLADAEERDEHNSGPGITTNENLVSFQYLKTLPAEGDNGTLGTRSQESEDSLSRDSTSKKSLITKPVKKKNSLAPSENESSKTADTISSKDDSVFHCFKNTDDYSNFHSEGSKSVDSGLMNKNDNSFTGKNRLDADLSKYAENHDGKDDDVFRDVPHFYVNGDDYALVQKDSRRSPRSTLIGDKSSIYANSSPRPKSGSSGSVQDSDVLEWTKGFNLAV